MPYFKRSTFIRAKSEELRENFLAYVFSVNGMLSKIYHHLVSRRIIDGKVPPKPNNFPYFKIRYF